jgi:alanyl-tRNA synthetase
MFKKFGYVPIKRYPIVARWNPTMEYTNASIAAFQPYVISGEADPPAKRLIIPQLCFRTVDIDNVGITGSHNTVFCMIGQHMFVKPKEWDQNMALEHIHAWLKKGLGLPNEEITFHEDAWAGGGNLGPCMEFFSRGCELGNQVYMMYEQAEKGAKNLSLKVLDMGMGQERNTWFSQGCNTIYDAAFPAVISYLESKTGIIVDKELVGKFVPYSGLLNLDEIDNIDKAWEDVARKVHASPDTLKKNIMPLAGLYSVAEHSRALLVMFSDGALPSNTGDSYNLRIILRRMLGFIDKFGWDIDVHKLFEMHAAYLKKQFPELSQNLENAKKIFDVEKEKYEKTKVKSRLVIEKTANRDVGGDELARIYDSHGIPPELIAQEAEKIGKKIQVPDNFYRLVSELHSQLEQKHATKKPVEIEFGALPPTKALYFGDYKKTKNSAKVLKIVDNYVVLDSTSAYPTSGGQMHDLGSINSEEFIDVFKQGPLIVHKMKEKPKFKEGKKVIVEVNKQRRVQLAKNHTSAHIVNYAARKVLGNHVNQASAFKDTDKAHLDITHYKSITDKELDEVEKISNAVIKKSIKIEKKFLKRDRAEKKFGTDIYQGGVVPGRDLRIVNIRGADTEACGGTHLDSTKEAEKIVIISAEHISDSISRISFLSGAAANAYLEKQKEILKQVENLLGVKGEKTIEFSAKLFAKWKKGRKLAKKESEKESEKLRDKIELDKEIIVKILDANSGELRLITKDFKKSVMMLFGTKDMSVVASGNGSIDVGALLKKIAEALSGKGGGSRVFAQGIYKKKPDIEDIRKMIENERR